MRAWRWSCGGGVLPRHKMRALSKLGVEAMMRRVIFPGAGSGGSGRFTADDLDKDYGKADSARVFEMALSQSTHNISRYGMLLAIPGGILEPVLRLVLVPLSRRGSRATLETAPQDLDL